MEAEVYSENVDLQSPLQYSSTLGTGKNTYKLEFTGDQSHNNYDVVYYLIVSPVQPNASFEVKISANWVPTWVFWTAVVGGIATVLIFVCSCICRLLKNEENKPLAAQDENRQEISQIESTREPVSDQFRSSQGQWPTLRSSAPTIPLGQITKEPNSAI